MQIRETCPLAGKTVKITSGPYEGNDYVVEDWACNVFGAITWELKMGNPAILDYLAGHDFQMSDDKHDYMITAMYGKVGLFGKVVRWEEIEVPNSRTARTAGSTCQFGL